MSSAEMPDVYRQHVLHFLDYVVRAPKKLETAGICRKNPSSISWLDGK